MRQLSFALLSFLLIAGLGCSTGKFTSYPTNKHFKPSETTADSILIHYQSRPSFILAGKARIILSQPNASDRFTSIFEADSSKSKIRIRNTVGIEAVHLYQFNDSIDVYNRVDDKIDHYEVNDPELIDITGVLPVNIYNILYPQLLYNQSNWMVGESEDEYLLENPIGDRLFFSKTDLKLRRIEQIGFYGNVVSLIFNDFITFHSTLIPRTIEITNRIRNLRMMITLGKLSIQTESITPFNWQKRPE